MASGTISVVQGSDQTPRITFQTTGGKANDISGASEVEWRMYETVKQTATAILTKKKSSGAITFPNGGSDGIMDVPIANTDLASKEPGAYEWQIRVTVGGSERVSEVGVVALLTGGDFTT